MSKLIYASLNCPPEIVMNQHFMVLFFFIKYGWHFSLQFYWRFCILEETWWGCTCFRIPWFHWIGTKECTWLYLVYVTLSSCLVVCFGQDNISNPIGLIIWYCWTIWYIYICICWYVVDYEWVYLSLYLSLWTYFWWA